MPISRPFQFLTLTMAFVVIPVFCDFTHAQEHAESAEHHEKVEKKTAPETKKDKKAGPTDAVLKDTSVTQHNVTVGGKKITYTATAGKMMIKNSAGKDRASVFFIAYTKDNVEDKATRPVTFAFNGGPGSASVWLHLGVLGPRKIKFDEFGNAPGPPYTIVDNDQSLLDITDIVLIDPVSTGYSRPVENKNAGEFHGYQEDVQSVGDFIWSYVTHKQRWSSPKFLLGESYGTTRAAGLSGHLQDRYGMYLNGLILVSVVLDFQTLRFGTGNDLPYMLFLPTYAATAWHHKQLDEEIQKKKLADLVAEVEQFALKDYALALLQGGDLPKDERDRIKSQLAKYTGLSEDFIDQNNLRVSMGAFAKELMRDAGKTVGRFDSRYIGIDRTRAGDRYDYDPSKAALFGPFGSAINQYLRDELKVESTDKYMVFGNIGRWNYSQFTGRYVNVSQTLRSAMTENQNLKVFCANGYYDLATPHFAAEYTFSHLGLHESLRKNVTMGYYEAGHMMYVHDPSLKKFKRDMERFYEDATSSGAQE